MKVIRISKILLAAIALATVLTCILSIITCLVVRPYRYTGKAYAIHLELAPPAAKNPNNYEFGKHTGYSTLVEGNLKHFDENGIELSEDEYQRRNREVIDRQSDGGESSAGASLAPAAVTPAYIERKGTKEKPGPELIFGGTEEFFQFCNNSDGVIWNPADIEASIDSRELYLVSKIKQLMIVSFAASFSIFYLGLFVRKRGIRVVIE
jgi:hypothetical protein